MSNDDLTYGFMSNVENLVNRLRGAADRIDRDAHDIRTVNGRPQHSAAAASIMQEVVALMGNLPAYNLIANAAYADAAWQPETVTVMLTGVDPGEVLPTIREVRQAFHTLTGHSMSLVDGRDIVYSAAGGTVSPPLGTVQPMQVSPVVVSGVSREQAEAVRGLLARVGATVEFV